MPMHEPFGDPGLPSPVSLKDFLFGVTVGCLLTLMVYGIMLKIQTARYDFITSIYCYDKWKNKTVMCP